MKISFDFDHTLSVKKWQQVATALVKEGHEVWITTSRFHDTHKLNRFTHNSKVYAVADRVGISRERIQYTNMLPKWSFLDGFDMHFDDDNVEIMDIQENLKECTALLV